MKVLISIFCSIIIVLLVVLCYLGFQINNKLDKLEEIKSNTSSIPSISHTVDQIRGKLGIPSYAYYP